MGHAPSHILESLCQVCSSMAPNLTSPRALRSRVLQAATGDKRPYEEIDEMVLFQHFIE
jgi:hypothetical protein